MKDKIKNFFLKPHTEWKFWILLALLVKGIIYFHRIIQHDGDTQFHVPGFWGYLTADSFTYNNPIDFLLTTGSYGIPVRLPGYGFIYLLFRLFFSQGAACNGVIILQYVLSSVSVYCLAIIVKNISNSMRMFYIVYYMFLISTYSNWMDVDIMTESFSTTFLIFSMFFLAKFFEKKQMINIMISGSFLTWVIFIRPFFILFLPVFICLLAFKAYKDKLQTAKVIILFISSFIIIDGLWTIRNYHIYKQFIPLTIHAGGLPSVNDCQMSAVRFVQSFGGDFRTGAPESIYHWFGFMDPPTVTKYDGPADPIPKYIYTSKFNKDSLVMLKGLCTSLENSTISDSLKESGPQAKVIINTFDRYTLSVKKEKFFLYYVKAPINYTEELLTFPGASFTVIGYSAIHKGVFNYLNNINYLLRKMFTINPVNWLYMIFNYIVLALGFIGMLFIARVKGKNVLSLIFILIPFITIIGHAVLLRMPTNRFIMPAWPFIVICASYCIDYLSTFIYSSPPSIE